MTDSSVLPELRSQLLRAASQRAAGDATSPVPGGPHRRRIALIVAAAAVIVAAVVVPMTVGSTSPTRHQATPKPTDPAAQPVRSAGPWRLTGYVVPPGWKSQGGLDDYALQMTCSSATTCFVPGRGLGASGDVRSFQAQMLVTRDSGATWKQSLVTPPGVYLYGTSCPTATTCMVAGTKTDARTVPHVYTTHDDGRSWSSTALPKSFVMTGMALSCASVSTCVTMYLVPGPGTTGPQPVAYVTTDAGGSWRAATLPGGFAPADGNPIQCSASGECVASGISGDSAYSTTADMLYSSDGGAHWGTGATPTVPATIGKLSCGDAEHCVSIEVETRKDGRLTAGVVLTTDDGGRSWAASRPTGLTSIAGFTPVNIDSISCPTVSRCWASGEAGGVGYADSSTPAALRILHGFIVTSADGGGSWTTEALPPIGRRAPQTVQLVSCPTPNACLAIGSPEDASKPEAVFSNRSSSTGSSGPPSAATNGTASTA